MEISWNFVSPEMWEPYMYCLLQEEGDDASGKSTRQHAVSFDAALEREQGEPRTRGAYSMCIVRNRIVTKCHILYEFHWLFS